MKKGSLSEERRRAGERALRGVMAFSGSASAAPLRGRQLALDCAMQKKERLIRALSLRLKRWSSFAA